MFCRWFISSQGFNAVLLQVFILTHTVRGNWNILGIVIKVYVKDELNLAYQELSFGGFFYKVESTRDKISQFTGDSS